LETPSRFKEKVVLVTGASQGIGEAISLRFSSEGADLVPCANEERIFDVADKVKKLGTRILALVIDVSVKTQVVSMFKRIQDEFNALDVAVHNAGTIKIARSAELSAQDWDEVLDVNCKGEFFCCQCAAQLMIPKQRGRIINAASGRHDKHAFSLLILRQIRHAW